MKEQSETARKYLIFKDELKKLDINAFLLDVDDTQVKLESYEEKLSIVETDASRLKDEFEAAKDEYERIEQQLESYNEKIDTSKNEIHEKKLSNQRLEGEMNVINQQKPYIGNVRDDMHQDKGFVPMFTMEQWRSSQK